MSAPRETDALSRSKTAKPRVGFTHARDAEDLLAPADERATAALPEALRTGDRERVHTLAGDGQIPLPLAVSNSRPQMRSHTTREFLAGMAIATRFGRPGTPTDQAWIETLFGHVKGEWPHLEKTRDPGELDHELDRVRHEYNTVRRLHAGIGYVTPPTTNTKVEATRSVKHAATDSPQHATRASPTVEPQHPRRTRDRAPTLAGYFNPRLVH